MTFIGTTAKSIKHKIGSSQLFLMAGQQQSDGNIITNNLDSNDNINNKYRNTFNMSRY